MIWLAVIAFMLGGFCGGLTMAIVAAGPSAEREWDACRRGYQLGVTEERR